jgi:serine/threonine-protein kinase RsbW
MEENLRVSRSIKNLKEIRSFVDKRLKELYVSEMEINMMVLAVDEICANLIIHANTPDEDQHLEVKIKDESEGVAFEISDISDKGEAFNFNNYQVPELNDIVKNKRKGGLGLMLVKRIMDKIEFTKENDYTVCRLFKKVHFANHSA